MASLNLANALTVGRILLVPVLVLIMLEATPGGSVLAAAAFVLAALTDGLDGWVARSRQSVTTFGKVMDPVADKLLIAAALVVLVDLDRLAAWAAVVIVARELAVTGLRAVAGRRGLVISASRLGKLKTFVQVVTVTVLIAVPDASAGWVDALVYLMVAVTVVSGADYFAGTRRRDGGRAGLAGQPAAAGIPASRSSSSSREVPRR